MNILEKVLNKFKSYYVNYKVFPRNIAKKMPLYVSYKTKCTGLRKGCIIIDSKNIYNGMIQFGIKSSDGIHNTDVSYLCFAKNGICTFKGRADFSKGFSLNVVQNGKLTIGEGFFSNAASMIRCRHCITIGSDNMWGWNVVLMDGDGHPIRNKDGEIVNNDCPIYIGNNVWLGSYSRIMKGADIKDGCTVGLGSLVTSENIHENSIIVGVPAVEKRHEMFWDRGEFPDV